MELSYYLCKPNGICQTHTPSAGVCTSRAVADAKEVKKTHIHLKDFTSAQVATILSGLLPEITPLRLLKIGGEVVQATWHSFCILYLPAVFACSSP